MCVVRVNLTILFYGFILIFSLTGSFLVVIGAIYELTFTKLQVVIPAPSHALLSYPALTILAGGALIIATLIGCLAFYTRKWKLFKLCSVILLCVVVYQLLVGFFFIFNPRPYDVDDQLIAIFNDSEKNSDWIVEVQSQLKCCGPQNSTFWSGKPLPQSCCTDQSCGSFHEQGCSQPILFLLNGSITLMGVSLLTIALLEAIGSLLLYQLANREQGRSPRWRQINKYDNF